MKYLLDTHIILWALIDDPRLTQETKDIIMNNSNSIFYSTISPWEVEIKHLKDKNFKLSAEQLTFLCDQNGLLNLSVQNKHVEELKHIDRSVNNNLFDRMLLAQAISENMILITNDKKFMGLDNKHLMIV